MSSLLRRAAALIVLSSTLSACRDSGSADVPTPTANAGRDQAVWKGDLVTLDGGESVAQGGGTLAYQWRQTEGPTVPLSDDRAARPTFQAPPVSATLRFSLQVVEGGGTSAPDDVIVAVRNRAPYAAAGADAVVAPGNVMTLDPRGSSDPDGDPTSAAWFQVSGPPVVLEPHADGSATFVAPATPSVLEFGLVVSDGEATSAADGLRVQVVDESANWPPVASAGPDREVARRAVVTLSGSAIDRESDPITFTWLQTAGPSVLILGDDGPWPSFVAPETECDLEFQLVVADALSTGSDRVAVRVRNQPPEIHALELSPIGPVTTDPLVATVVTSDPDGDSVTLAWEWERNGALLAGEVASTLDPSFTTRGDTILVRVSASDGARVTVWARSVTIADAPPVFVVTAPEVATWGVPVTFAVTASDPDGDPMAELVLLHGPAGMTLSPSGAGAWTPSLPMFERTLEVAFAVGVSGMPAMLEERSIRVEDPDRAYPLRRSGIEIPSGNNALVAADLGGDGTTELLVAGRTGLYELGYAGGGYAQRWGYPFAPGTTSISAIAATDADGDGKPEIYFSTSATYGTLEPSVLVELDGVERREARRAELACLDLEAADVDGDGTVELVCLATASGYYGALQAVVVLDAATLDVERQTPQVALGESLALGNVDADAALEIVTAAGHVFDGVSCANEWAYGSGFGMVVDTGDLDGDGVEEIVGMDSWSRFRGFSAVLRSPIWEQPVFDSDALLVADVDSDGAAEIVVGDGQWGNVTAYRYQPLTNDLAIAHQIDSQDHGVQGLVAGDVDGDGSLELAWGSGGSSSGEDIFVVAGRNPTLAVEWMNVGPSQLDGPFLGAKPARTVAGAAPAVLFAVPRTNSGYDGARLLRLDPVTGAVATSVEIGTNWEGAGALDAVDFDADGVDELLMATASYYDSYLTAWDFAAGAASWTSPTLSGGGQAITHADLNGDGAADLVALTSDGFAQAWDLGPGALLWKSTSIGVGVDIEVADVDGDGVEEIIALSTTRLVLFEKAVGGPVPWIEAGSVEVSGSDLAVGDCDGDGAPELYVLGVERVWRYDGALTLQGSFFTQGLVFSLFVEELGTARKNLVLGRGDQWVYSGVHSSLEGVDAFTGAHVWESPPLWGTVAHNSLGYVDLDGDGSREIAFGTSLGMYLTAD
jgi:hypothetical protein